MKRNRVKAAGLGLALWAGYLHGQDPQPPAMLPAAVRIPAEWTPAPVLPAETVWLPAKSTESKAPKPLPASVKKDEPGGVVPATTGPALPESVKPAFVPVIEAPSQKPKLALPEIPVPFAPAPLPAAPAPTVPTGVVPSPATPMPVATPVAPMVVAPPLDTPMIVAPPVAAPMLVVAPVPTPSTVKPIVPPVEVPIAVPNIQKPDAPAKPDPLPKPRIAPPAIPRSKDSSELPPPTKVPVQNELPTAPPELMVPSGVPVPGKHGTFGSPGVRISKDFPAIHDLIDHDLDFGWFGSSPNTDSLAMDRLEFRAEYLLWWMNAQKIPILATTSVNGGLGFLDDSGTRTLLDPGSFGHSPRSGFRTRAGYWFDDCGTWGIDGSFFYLGNQASSASFDSSTFPTITRPIYAPNFPGEFGEIVALPGVSTGALNIEATSKLWGFDLNLRRALCKTCDSRSEVFAGYRSLALNETLTINEFITALPGNTNDPAGTMVTVSDNFQTRNRFNGGQVGYASERTWNRWSFEGRGSVALGNTSQTVEIAGFQSRLRPGMTTPDTFAGGLLATGPNLGKFEQNRFSVVPEFTLNVGYWITPVIKVYAGYNFLYWSNVVRAGDQIDRTVDVTFVPNPPPGVPFSGQYRPQPTFNQTNLSVNGIQFGIMGRW